MFPMYIVYILLIFTQLCYAPPVKESTKEHEDKEKGQDAGYNPEDFEYHRYLSEVVQALESDPEFKAKIETAPEEEIRSGKIADQLEFVSHHVRTKLDEIKRVELDRLKELVEKKLELQGNIDNEDPTHKHLDHSNPHTFEIEDLRKLIAKTHEDLNEADKNRREQFKEYELQKEFEKQQKLNSTTGEERAKLEKQFKETEEKHKKHEKLHEPGHKAQLEEVWQEQDQMQQEFDPKTFFLLHDMDSNGLWDQNEVKALFLKELDKMYQAGAPEDDIRERIEEMERMRETVFKEVDTNQDGVIEYAEFLAQTRRQDFKEDHGWNGIDEQKPYSDEELQEYISRHQASQFPQHPPPIHHQVPPGYQPPGSPQFHPGQIPQHPPQPVQGHPNMNTNEVYMQHPNNIPQNNFNQHPNQVYQQHPNQVYQQHNQPAQQHPNQVYQQHNQPAQQNFQQQNSNFQTQQQNQGNVQPPQTNYQQQQQQQPNQQYNNLQQQQQNQGNVPQQPQQTNQGNVPQQNFQHQQQQQQPPVQQGSYQQPKQVNAQADIQKNSNPQKINNVGPQDPVVNQV